MPNAKRRMTAIRNISTAPPRYLGGYAACLDFENASRTVVPILVSVRDDTGGLGVVHQLLTVRRGYEQPRCKIIVGRGSGRLRVHHPRCPDERQRRGVYSH